MTANWLIDIKLPKTINTHHPEPVGTKYSGGIVDYGLKGEKGVEGTKIERRNKRVAQKMTNRFNLSSFKKSDGTIDWDSIGFTDGIKPDRKEPFIRSAQLMYDYITSNNIVTKIGEVNIEVIIFPLLRKVIENSDCKLEDPSKFYDYCVGFIRERLPHYENIIKKTEREIDDRPRPCIDIEAQIISDLAKNVANILNKN